MSTFGARVVYCPACGAGTERTVVVSLNRGRRPDLRRQILDGTFQHVVCPACSAPHRLEDPFIYIDFDRKQWITCFPPAREPEWASLESKPRENWKEAMITYAPPLVRAWSAGFTVRAVFGQDALREKLVCFDQGVHDVWLTVMQLDAMRRLPEVGFHLARRLEQAGVQRTGQDDQALAREAVIGHEALDDGTPEGREGVEPLARDAGGIHAGQEALVQEALEAVGGAQAVRLALAEPLVHDGEALDDVVLAPRRP